MYCYLPAADIRRPDQTEAIHSLLFTLNTRYAIIQAGYSVTTRHRAFTRMQFAPLSEQNKPPIDGKHRQSDEVEFRQLQNCAQALITGWPG